MILLTKKKEYGKRNAMTSVNCFDSTFVRDLSLLINFNKVTISRAEIEAFAIVPTYRHLIRGVNGVNKKK